MLSWVREGIMNQQAISREDFEALSKEWTALDTEYDNLFQEFLNNPQVKGQEELEKFKAMQKRLYAIEDRLYLIAEGRMVIEG